LFVESAELEEREEMQMTNAAEIHFVAEEKVTHGLEEKKPPRCGFLSHCFDMDHP